MGIPERRRREREARIRQIRESAAAVFREKGFAGTTMEEIARRVEISKAALYLYFKSKEDLYYGLIEPALNRLSQKLKRLRADDTLPVEEKIRRMVAATYAFYEEDPEAYHLVARYRADEFSRLLAPEKLDHLKSLMKSNLYQVEEAIRQGVEQGIFRAVNPQVASIILWNAFMGVIQFQENRMVPGKSDYRRPTLEAAVELIITGLRKT
ncbi:MAG: TetR/AcrR family transcriptional regulator [Syntrophales bacterium]|nr:TetR/AcrR family transcriptional regulator [Syntrophales bacterium]